MVDDRSTDRLLGQLIAEVKSLHDRLDRSDRHIEDVRNSDRKDTEKLKEDVETLKEYMLRVEGGKRMLFGMLAVAATLGGFMWEILSRYLPFK
jgi:hypothetical protein